MSATAFFDSSFHPSRAWWTAKWRAVVVALYLDISTVQTDVESNHVAALYILGESGTREPPSSGISVPRVAPARDLCVAFRVESTSEPQVKKARLLLPLSRRFAIQRAQ